MSGHPVTWVKIDAPKLDMIQVVIGSFGLAGALALAALGAGVLFGIGFIFWRRRHPTAEQVAMLDLDLPATTRL